MVDVSKKVFSLNDGICTNLSLKWILQCPVKYKLPVQTLPGWPMQPTIFTDFARA